VEKDLEVELRWCLVKALMILAAHPDGLTAEEVEEVGHWLIRGLVLIGLDVPSGTAA